MGLSSDEDIAMKGRCNEASNNMYNNTIYIIRLEQSWKVWYGVIQVGIHSRWCKGVYSSIYVIELCERFVAMGEEDICQKWMLTNHGIHGTRQVSMSPGGVLI